MEDVARVSTIRRLILLCLKVAALLVILFLGAIYYIGKYDCHPSTEDVASLKQQSELYPSYHLKFDCESYLVVKPLEPITEESRLEVVDIYNKFFADDNGELKRKTTFLTLDLYDSTGCFQYQFVYSRHPADM